MFVLTPLLITLLFIVFPKDFSTLKNALSCKENSDYILESFPPSDAAPSLITDKSDALNECEFYCATEERCWGCSAVCNKSCQWNAVKDCRPQRNFEELSHKGVSRKAGKSK